MIDVTFVHSDTKEFRYDVCIVFHKLYRLWIVNGWKGNGNLTISDDGSGDTQNRETIGVGLNLIGKPERGTAQVTYGATITVEWTAEDEEST